MKKMRERLIIDNGYRKTLEREYVLDDGKLVNFLVFANSNGGDAVGILGLTETGKFVLIDEFRVGPEEVIQTCILGGIEDGSDPLETSEKEFLEESGYTYTKLIPITTVINNAYFIGKLHLFLATGCRKAQAQELEAGEEIVPREYSQSELEERILTGKIVCSFTISLYFLAKVKTNNFTDFHL